MEAAGLLPRTRLTGADKVLETAGAIKTPGQMASIGRASRLTEEAVMKALSSVHPGQTEKDLGIELMCRLLEAGAGTLRHIEVTVGDKRPPRPPLSLTKE
jgi:Xaa-Pro aminopeptidase